MTGDASNCELLPRAAKTSGGGGSGSFLSAVLTVTDESKNQTADIKPETPVSVLLRNKTKKVEEHSSTCRKNISCAQPAMNLIRNIRNKGRDKLNTRSKRTISWRFESQGDNEK